MRLALSMRVTGAASYVEPRDTLAQDWPVWIEALGYQAIYVPNSLSDPAAFLRSLDVSGVILTGGNDLVGRGSGPSDVAPERTRTERSLLETALAEGIPTLGVCRGLHVINDFFGGGLIADLKVSVPNLLPHIAKTHPVRLRAPFSEIAGRDVIDVNSFHNQGIAESDVSAALTVVARSGDGVVEGLVHPEHPILGIQWHPERPDPASSFDAIIAKRLFAEGAFWKGKLS